MDVVQIGSEESPGGKFMISKNWTPETWSRFGLFGVEDTSLPGLSGDLQKRTRSLIVVWDVFFFRIFDEGGDRTLLRQYHNHV